VRIEEQLEVVSAALATAQATIRTQRLLLSVLATLEIVESRMSFVDEDESEDVCFCADLIGFCEVCELRMVRGSIAEIKTELGVKSDG
jgi:hypothetical protein